MGEKQKEKIKMEDKTIKAIDDELLANERLNQDLTLYEIARRNMIAFADFFHKNETMTKEEWFRLQKEVLEKIKREIK